MIIGEQLRKARLAAGMSQEELAEFMAVSRQTVSNWENARSYPDIERVMRLAERYHLSLDELLRGDQQMVKSWLDAANVARTGKLLAAMLGLNLLLTLAIVVTSQIVWLAAGLLLLLVGCIGMAFFLMIKLI
ncbi:helix-turn-helix domain-containing protein [Lacticaseibacillus daqingensis]|uniref:helix-turn-helix domain-containing protein n=1 Tax=Lacticaseibacillus daqingensis TaxID=2486014 RepID=UPI000F7879B6|nr:helix-turn-helix transcriptional regulator [Lacticaseibacillus daqingensis]